MIPIPASLYFAIAKYALIISVIVGAAWWVYDAIYDRGWNDREQEAILEAAKSQEALDVAKKKIEAMRVESQTKLLKTINERNKREAELNNRINDLNDQRLYVSAKNKGCDNDGMPGTHEDTGVNSGGTGRVELSQTAARNIRRDYINGQQVVNQYLALKELVEASTQCFEIVE